MLKKNRRYIFPSRFSAAFDLIKNNPIVLYPFVVVAFLELFAIELLYFLPRWPLNLIFNPIAQALGKKHLLIYPANMVLVYRLFYYAQLAIYLFIGGLMISTTYILISQINQNKTANFKAALKAALKKYVEIFCAALTLILSFMALNAISDFIINKLAFNKIGMNVAFVVGIKRALLTAAPYISIICNVLAETLFAYLMIKLVLANKKLLPALKENFLFLKGRFLLTFMLIFIPVLPLLPFFYLTTHIGIIMDKLFPEIAVILLVVRAALALFVNAFIATLIASVYITAAKKENA